MLRRYFRSSLSAAFFGQNSLLPFRNSMDSVSFPAVPAKGARFSTKSSIHVFCSEYFDSEIQKVSTEIIQARNRIESLKKAKEYFFPVKIDVDWAQRRQPFHDEINKIEMLDQRLRSLKHEKTMELDRLERAHQKQAPYLISTPPVEFHEQTDGEHKMFVANSIPNSTIVGPVYLPNKAANELFHFAQSVQTGDATGLFIVGPPQSGKSAVIHEVLPAIFASCPSNVTRVVVKLKFSRDETPVSAANKILDQVKAAADAFGVGHYDKKPAHSIAFPFSTQEQYWYIKSIAQTFRVNHFQFWLLIDDCHMPMVNARNDHDVVVFTNFLSNLISKGDHSICFVATISNMATHRFTGDESSFFYSQIKFYFQGDVVHLGHALPSDSWATRAVTEIKSSILELTNNRRSLHDLDPKLVLNAISNVPDKLNCRPAIIRQLLQLYAQKQHVDGASVESILQECVNELSDKLIQQSSADFLIALDDIHHQCGALFLNKLRLIADGTKSTFSTLFPECAFASSQSKPNAEFLLSVYRYQDDAAPVLLPPYAHLCKQLVPFENIHHKRSAHYMRRCEISKYARDRVKFWSAFKDKFTAEDKHEIINEPIVQILLTHGIGARNQCNELIAVRSVFDHPLLCEQHRLSVSDEQFKMEKAEYDAWVSSGADGIPPQGPYPVGLQAVLDLQHLKPFDSCQPVDLSVPQWRMITLDALLIGFTRRFDFTSVGKDFTKDLRCEFSQPS